MKQEHLLHVLFVYTFPESGIYFQLAYQKHFEINFKINCSLLLVLEQFLLHFGVHLNAPVP
jgi:hypothetical protein